MISPSPTQLTKSPPAADVEALSLFALLQAACSRGDLGAAARAQEKLRMLGYHVGIDPRRPRMMGTEVMA